MSEQPPIRHFAIVTFRKVGPLRFLSHLDLARVVDRAVRRAGLPVKYSEGFNPSARIGYCSALPVGTAGEREQCQIEMESPVAVDEVHRALARELPEDLGVVEVEVVSGTKRRHLSGYSIADYEIELWPDSEVSAGKLRRAASDLLEAGTIRVVRETKSRSIEIDILPGIEHLSVEEPRHPGEGPRIQMSLALEQDRLAKPSEVLQELERRLCNSSGREVGLDVRVATRRGLRTGAQ